MAAPGPLHPSATETQRKWRHPATPPRDGLVLGDRRVSRPFGGQPRPRHHPGRSLSQPLAVPLLENPAGTGAGGCPDLRQPSRAPAFPEPRPGQGCPSPRRGSAPFARCPGSSAAGCSGAALAPTCGCRRTGEASGGGGILPATPARAGQTPVQPALRLEGAPLLPPLHPPPPPGRSPALPWGDAAGSSPSLLGVRGPPAPPAGPHGASPHPSARTWGR